MNEQQRQHMQSFGPTYLLFLFLGGGTGFATLTDSIPVTKSEFTKWTDSHNAAPHTQSSAAIEELSASLRTIRLGQVRSALSTAYKDRCNARDTALEYIDREIRALQDEHVALTQIVRDGMVTTPGRRYDPKPCL